MLVIAALALLPHGLVLALDDDPLSDPTHFDLPVVTDPPAQPGARLRIDPDQVFPVAYLTGRRVIPANFSDVAGGPYTTDDPGWFADPGFFVQGEDLRFRPLGALRFWDPVLGRWLDQVPRGEAVRLFPGIPPEILAEILVNNDADRRFQWLMGYSWTSSGIEGPPERQGMIAIAGPGGSIHSHLDFCLQNATGFCPPFSGEPPSKGAYLVELQLFSTASAAGSRKYLDSQAIQIVLAHDISPAELQRAVNALTTPPEPSADEPPDLPASGVLILSGD